MKYTIYVNGTTDENAVTAAYSYIARPLKCSYFAPLPNKNNGGLAFIIESNATKQQIVDGLSPHLPEGAYAF